MNSKHVCGWLAVALIALSGCVARPTKSSRSGAGERVARVETVQPEYSPRKMTVELLATVEPLEKADLCAQVPGEVKDLPSDIDIGRPIKKGEELLTLDIPAIKAEQLNKQALLTQAENQRDLALESRKVAAQEVEEAKAQVLRYKADLDFRQLQLRRVSELARRNTVSPQLQEESELQRNAARAALTAARATTQTKEARLKAAEKELVVAESRIQVARADVKLLDAKVGFATIRAPFNGMITRRWVDNGAVIKDPGAPLLTVMRTNQVRVLIDVPERYVPMIRATQSRSPRGEANRVLMQIQEYQVEGRITRLASAIDNMTRLMRAEIHVRNHDEIQLRPGMTGTATVILDEGETRHWTIPSTALVRSEENIKVYCIEPTGSENPPRGKVRAVVVRTGLDDGKTVEILSGLTGKEQVIAKGNGPVREGETAIAVKAREQKRE
jgi:RND family efflux transporter MFP subunit